ncbi:MAG TPA: DUF2207 domain-containing protein, partial [Herpetosiphonaceae bacterium]
MRRLTALALLALWLLAACGGQADKSYVWQEFNSAVSVGEDGVLRVAETLTLRFEGGPFTFAFRDLPRRRLDSISAIRVSEGDRAFRQVDDNDSDEPYTFSVDPEGDVQRVRWVYPPTTGGVRTITLSYEVAGAVRRNGENDEIWWALVPAARDAAVERSVSSVAWPATVPPGQVRAETPDAPGRISSESDRLIIAADAIPEGAELTVRAFVPPGLIGGGTAAWQAAEQRQASYDATTRPAVNRWLSAAAAALLLGGGLALWAWRRRNHDPRGADFAAGALPDRPGDLAPAEAAKLLRSGDGPALAGTILDLAQRGHLTLHEAEPTKVWRQPQVLARRAPNAGDDLREYEQAALARLFDGQAEVKLSDRQSALLKELAPLGGAAQRRLIEAGLADDQALRRRQRALVWSTLLLIASVIALIPGGVLAERYSWWLPIIPAVGAALSLLWVILSASLRGLTPAGAQALARWQAFQRYLRSLKPDAAGAGRFAELLPYAAALGVESKLVKAYSLTPEPLPHWYFPVMGSGNSVSAGAGQSLLLQDFSQNFLASLSGTSVSAGGGAGGAVGGASGGG